MSKLIHRLKTTVLNEEDSVNLMNEDIHINHIRLLEIASGTVRHHGFIPHGIIRCSENTYRQDGE